MARRPGFTLVELLTVLAVLSVLAAVLLPAIASIRAAAMKVVCTSRLRDLTLACNAYLMEERAYPQQPGTRTTAGGLGSLAPPVLNAALPPRPTDLEPAFLNALAGHLPFPRVDVADGPEQLAPALQCPTVEDAAPAGRLAYLDLAMTRPAFYTGYAYCARPRGATLSPLIQLLKPDRVAAVRPAGARAVLWADDVQWSVPDLAYRFAHPVSGAKRGPAPLTFAGPEGLLGQHVAYTDGSVEWVPGHELSLREGPLGVTPLSTGSGHRASLSTLDLFFAWF